MKLNIKDITRTGHVTRWQIVRTARQQTLAEHQYIATMLAQHIYNLTMPPQTYDSDKCQHELLLLRWMLRHDVPEVLTGDVSGPMKRKLCALIPHDPFWVIESEIDPVYADLKCRVHGTVFERIGKLADLLEAIVFLHTEGMGTHAETVKQKLIDRYDDHLEECRVDYPIWGWAAIRDLRDELMRGEDGMMVMEETE